MRDYSHSGDFGEVKLFDTFPLSGQLESEDQLTSVGWHRVNELYRVKRPEGSSAGLILFTLSGSGRVTVGDKELLATSGSVAVIPARTPHEYRTASADGWEFYWIHFHGCYSDRRVQDLACGGKLLFDVGRSWIELFFGDYFSNRTIGVERELEIALWLNRLFHLLLKKMVTCRYDKKGLAGQMMAFLEEDTDSCFSLENFAREFHYSKEYLIRLFKKATGITPYHYWILVRIKRSCIDLEKGEKSIAQIALECGYKEIGSYSKQFKKCYGISPNEYRRLHGFVQN